MDEKELKELSKSPWDKAINKLREGDIKAGIELIQIIRDNCQKMHNQLTEWIWSLLTFIANKFGEEEVFNALRFRYECFPIRAEGVSVEDLVRREAVYKGAAHHSNIITITEEKDRFVIKENPCGSGGRMRKLRLDTPPTNLGTTSKGYNWSWGKKDVSYYCAHCCVREIMTIEAGIPLISVVECPLKPDDPCYTYIYKKPELVPQKYFQRIGISKNAHL